MCGSAKSEGNGRWYLKIPWTLGKSKGKVVLFHALKA